jgi:hypothetical protein
VKPYDKKGAAIEIAIKTGAGGIATGGTGAAIAGSAEALKHVVQWVRQNSFGGNALATLQEDRLVEAIEEAARVVDAMRMRGIEPRKDWFDIELENDKVKAAPSGLEGTLISAANEFERRKVKLVANLWSQLAFNPSVGFEASVFHLKTANELSYQQLAILATIVEMNGPPPTAHQAELDLALADGPIISPNTGYDSSHNFSGSSTTAMQVFDLVRRDIIRQEKGNEVPADTRQIKPWRCSPTLIGKQLYVLTAMRTHIPLELKEELAAELVKHS